MLMLIILTRQHVSTYNGNIQATYYRRVYKGYYIIKYVIILYMYIWINIRRIRKIKFVIIFPGEFHKNLLIFLHNTTGCLTLNHLFRRRKLFLFIHIFNYIYRQLQTISCNKIFTHIP